MRRLAHLILFLLASAALVACSQKSGVHATALTLGAAPPGAPMRAGYITLVNHDDRVRTLTHARSAAWNIVEFHVTETIDGVARMRERNNLEIEPGGELRFEPFGLHLMLMRPTDLAAERPMTIELCFADSECLTVSTAGETP